MVSPGVNVYRTYANEILLIARLFARQKKDVMLEHNI